MNEVKQLVADIKDGKLKPIYLLMGEEPYYIDKISEFIENNVLDEAEKGFNQMVMYGADVSVDDIVANAKRFPMMAERQVVIVKEAQALSRTIEKLVNYAKNPQESTVLVICYKYKKVDKRKALYKTVKKAGVVFESKPLRDYEIADWIRRVLSPKGYPITPKAAQMLADFLGTDLSKIDNELNKLKIITPKGTQITPELIEKNIGISKDFNNFELRKAVGFKNETKAHQIINYFANNPKDNPIVVTIGMMHNYFTQLLHYHGLNDRSPRNVASKLGINPYFVEEYAKASKNYPMKNVSKAIEVLREFDVKSKGVGAQNLTHHDILKEMLYKIMN